MSLNHRELRDIITELSAVLVGRRLTKINAPSPCSCQLVFGDFQLLVDLAAGSARMHLMEKKLPGPPVPPGWIMKLRNEIQDRLLDAVTQASGDRVVWLVFRGSPDRPQRSLLIELFGRNGRLLLLDGQQAMLYAAIGEAGVGSSYQPPLAAKAMLEQTSRFLAPDVGTLACNRSAEAFFAQETQAQQVQQLRQQILKELRRQKQRLERRVAHMEHDLSRAMEGESLQRRGEALKFNLHRVHKGETQVELPDPMDPNNPAVLVDLDPALSPKDNMQKLFARARRLKLALGGIQKRLGQARAELARIEEALPQVSDAATIDGLASWATTKNHLPSANPKRRPKVLAREPFKRYLSDSRREILVGRSGRDNHNLTFKVAKGSDLWLHARDAAGAHVIVPASREEEIDSETLLDAATLAAYGSELKNSSRVEVTYTQAKNVHPIKGAPLGLVSVARGKTILVRMDPKRISRLLESKEDGILGDR